MSTIHPPDPKPYRPTLLTPLITTEHGTGTCLPLPITTFVGREREFAQIGEHLSRDDVRLLTLVGPGGVGKSRLALEAMLRASAAFVDGATFVPLAPLHDPASVLSTVASAVGVQDTGGASLVGLIARLLQGKEVLLVLDNLEHVIDAAPLIAELLADCPGLTVLATSREVLHLSGEHIIRVPPLALPDFDELPASEELNRYDGVQLFVQRARAAEPGFQLTEGNAATVVAICQRLDGLPLAIELGAARISHLPLEALLARLERRLPLLSGGPRDQPTRFRTMRDAIAWSHDLLVSEEQQLFWRLGVFAGGFTLEAAEAVAGVGTTTAVHVLDSVTSLLDKSLVQSLPVRTEAEPRFGMLETIREYAMDQLAASGEEADIRQNHARYMVALAERFWGALSSPEADHWMQRLRPEIDNVRAALAWMLVHAPDEALQLVGALDVYWIRYNHFNEGREWVERALMASAETPSLFRARALLIAGWLAIEQDDLSPAESYLTEALNISLNLADQRFLADCFAHLGGIALRRGDLERARHLHEKAWEHAHLTGEPVYLAVATLNLGRVAMATGDLSRARNLLEEALAIHRSGWAPFGSVVAQYFLGRLSLAQRDYAKAFVYFRVSVHGFADAGDLANAARSLEGLARALVKSQARSATNLLGAATEIRKRVGRPRGEEDGPTYEQTVQAAQAELGDAAYAAAWEAGKHLSWDEIISEVGALAVSSAERHVSSPSEEQDAHGLTQREHEILILLAEGRSDREIAEVLGLRYRTVTSYVRNILDKLDVTSRTAAATHAVRRGLV